MLLDALITLVLLPSPQRARGRSYCPICTGYHSGREDVLGVTTVPTCKHDILTHESPPPETARLSTREIDNCVEEIHGFLPVKVSFCPDRRSRCQSSRKSQLQGRSGINSPCTRSGRDTTALATVDERAVAPWSRTDLPCIKALQGKSIPTTTAGATVDECAVTFCNQASLPCTDIAGQVRCGLPCMATTG